MPRKTVTIRLDAMEIFVLNALGGTTNGVKSLIRNLTAGIEDGDVCAHDGMWVAFWKDGNGKRHLTPACAFAEEAKALAGVEQFIWYEAKDKTAAGAGR